MTVTEAAAEAALDKAIKNCAALGRELKAMRAGESCAASMSLARSRLAELTQRVHEYNAYHNASKH